MEIVFNCTQCDQELSVDSEAAGSEFNCPTCGAQLIVPQQPDGEPAPGEPAEAPRGFGPSVVNAMKMSASAKEEHHFKVPMRDHVP